MSEVGEAERRRSEIAAEPRLADVRELLQARIDDLTTGPGSRTRNGGKKP